MSFQTTFTNEVAKLAEVVTSGATLRLFLTLPRHLSYTQFKRLDQTAVGTALSMNQSTVSKALKELLEIGVVERRGKGPVVEWRLSPDFGWRGTVDDFHAEQRKRGKAAPSATSPEPPIVGEYILWKLEMVWLTGLGEIDRQSVVSRLDAGWKI